MHGWNILYIIFPRPGGFPYACLSIHPSSRLSVFTDGTAHARLNCYGKKRPIWGPWKRFHNTTLISNVWNRVYAWNFKHMIATQLLPWKPQYSYNFRHAKSVRHLKFHPSESNKVAVIFRLEIWVLLEIRNAMFLWQVKFQVFVKPNVWPGISYLPFTFFPQKLQTGWIK